MTAENIFRVPSENMPKLQANFEKLGKKAAKLGLTPPRLETFGTEDVPLLDLFGYVEEGSPYREAQKKDDGTFDLTWGGKPVPLAGYRRYFLVEVVGDAPSIPGYALLGVVEHGDHEVGNVIRCVPGQSVPVEYRKATGWCDHCKTQRRRLETFILKQTEGGKVLQVGRNCLADFCRSPEYAAQLAGIAEILSRALSLCGMAEDDDSEFRSGRTERRVPVTVLLSYTTAAIRVLGWLSRSKVRERSEAGEFGLTATADIVATGLLTPPNCLCRRDKELIEKIERNEGDDQLAESALEWVRGMRDQADTLEDYLYNLLVVLTDESVERKHFGIACSAIAAYQRHMRKVEEDARIAQRRDSGKHVGTVGKREVFVGLTVKSIKFFPGTWNDESRAMVRFEDPAGNTLVWWTGGDAGNLKEGETHDIKGSVKEHGEYKGWPQTVITRCAVYVEKVKAPRKPRAKKV